MRKNISKNIPVIKNLIQESRAKEVNFLNTPSWSVKKMEGWSNLNYKLHSEELEKDFLVRVPISGKDEAVNRSHEYHNIKVASELGLTNDYFYTEESGFAIREFLEGEAPVDADRFNTSHLLPLIKAVKKLHSSKSNVFINRTDNLQIIIDYYKLLENPSFFYKEVIPEVINLQKAISKLKIPLVNSHNDLNPNNFIIGNNDDFYILDWEYSGLEVPHWDLSYLLTHGDINGEDENKLLLTYFGDELKKYDVAMIDALKPFSLLIFTLWIRLQISKNNFPVEREKMEYWEVTLNQDIGSILKSESYSKATECLNIVKKNKFQG